MPHIIHWGDSSGAGDHKKNRSFLHILTGVVTAGAVVGSMATPALALNLPVAEEYYPSAEIGFHDWDRSGNEREIRNDLSGSLSGMVELVQSSTSSPQGNAEEEMPTAIADRTTLLLFTPTEEISGASVKVSANGNDLGTVELNHPNKLPASDQNYDERGDVAYSLRSWSVELPAEWVQHGMELTFSDAAGTSGSVNVDIAAPTEIVINNIRLGMLTDAPIEDDQQRFITDPANGASDYFETMPVSKMTMAQYEDVTLDEVIVASGDIYTVNSPDPSEGSVYAGTMRENVGKAQVSTGINLATWGITSSEMTQKQPGLTNQRVIHHSAGLYSNGVHKHGLSGGNGMATLYSSVGNELSHELGHSYGIGHYPGTNTEASGDDIIRDASHNMDSGWGYISYRGLMRSNLDVRDYEEVKDINGYAFGENLQGKYNFNTDTMAGGWDASPVSDYTHMTGYTQKRVQEYLQTLVADTSYPSGYRDWDEESGTWVDAASLNPDFDLLAPKTVGGSVFTILGGYNPADASQTLVYPAFRSNYGVTFDLPQADTTANSTDRVCWLGVDFANGSSQAIELDATDGVKQLNVNIAEDEQPTAAQVSCRVDGVTTELGNQIDIDTNLPPMEDPVVVGQDAGFETLRAQELAELDPILSALDGEVAPSVSATQLTMLRGWSDDLSALSPTALTVAEKILELDEDATTLAAYLNDPASQTASGISTLVAGLKEDGYIESDEEIVPAGSAVTIYDGRCLYVDDAGAVLVDADAENCATNHDDAWFSDAAGRIHHAANPDLCLTAASPVTLENCAVEDIDQRWELQEPNEAGAQQILRASNGQALDYFVHQGYPGIYGSTGTNNQLWSGLAQSDNPLLSMLDGATTLKLYEAVKQWDPSTEPETTTTPEASPEPTPEKTPEPTTESKPVPEEEVTPTPDKNTGSSPSESSFAEQFLAAFTKLFS